MDFGFWTWPKYLDMDLNLIQIFGSGFKKKSNLLFLEKWIWIENLI